MGRGWGLPNPYATVGDAVERGHLCERKKPLSTLHLSLPLTHLSKPGQEQAPPRQAKHSPGGFQRVSWTPP